jgi:hypothetical protein
MKIIGICPTCLRNIESGDDVVESDGVAYHEECSPASPVEIPKNLIVESAAVPGGVRVKKTKQAEQIEQLLAVVKSLSAQVAELTAKPAASEKPKRTSSEKGSPRVGVYYVIKGYPTDKRPPQCIKAMRALAQAAPEGGRMTEMEIWNALMAEPFPSTTASKSVGVWNYVQTPFHIFKYYKGPMVDAEYLLGPFDV